MANPNPKPPPKHGQIKKGEVRNPLGSRAHNPEVKRLSKLTVATYGEVIELVLTKNIAALIKMINDPNTPSIQVGVATSILKAIKRGDPTVLERFAERIVGKIPEVINVNSNTNANVNQQVNIIDHVALREALLKITGDV